MRIDAGVNGVLGIACLVGLSLTVLGFIDLGTRGIALFTLLGFVWLLVAFTGLAAELRRQRPPQDRRTDDE
jgi:hypothetical protein